MVSVQYTPIPETEVIIPATQGGISSFATITTDSYLSQALHGMMQNAGPYIGWTLDQWVQAFTAQAQQRCTAYPASCVGTDPGTLGAKYGAIAFQLMQGVSAPVSTPQSTPTATPTTTVTPSTSINVPQSSVPQPVSSHYMESIIVTTGSGDNTVPTPGIPNAAPSPDYVTQANASAGAVSDNTTQSAIAQSGGTPVAPVIPPGTVVLPTSLSWLGDTFAIGGMNIPVWMPLIAVVGFMFMQGQGGGRRGR